jgi:hypothetical protein
MEYKDFLNDFALRTLSNLDHIKMLKGSQGTYPVTQLWNSLLGLIVLPHENHRYKIPDRPMREYEAEGWPHITMDGTEPESLRDLLHNLRNSVAHFNVDFIVGRDREISAVKVWTEANSSGPRRAKGSVDWVGRIRVEDLERLARLIAKTYLRQSPPQAA